MAARVFRSINHRFIESQSYTLVTQDANSSSPSNMFSDDVDDPSQGHEKMSNIEMHQVFVGSSPASSPIGQQALDEAQSRSLLSSRQATLSGRFKRFSKVKANQISLISGLRRLFNRDKSRVQDTQNRTIHYQDGASSVFRDSQPFPKRKCVRNSINNQKYSFWSFLPLFLFEQFNQFWNLYFLFVAITQLPVPGSIFEDFWIGYWWTTAMPLAFVVSISMVREAFDDLQRKRRDYLINYEKHRRLDLETGTIETIPSCRIQTGDLVILNEGSRVPCDMVLLYCDNEAGSTYIKTDQLDGETDWKLRRPIPSAQKLNAGRRVEKVTLSGSLTVEAPHQDIYKFMGRFQCFEGHERVSVDQMDMTLDDAVSGRNVDALSLENTLWGSTRIASEGDIIGCAVYLGTESRQQLNANAKTTKTGKIDKELNWATKLLVSMLIGISFVMTMARGVHKNSYLYFGRFMLILSDIIPLSLRVYMDLAKIWFSLQIQRDRRIPKTTVRCTTIPEELGRIEYLFTDKTGTLTKNEMIFRKLQLTPPLLFQSHSAPLIHHHCISEVKAARKKAHRSRKNKGSGKSKRKERRDSDLTGINEVTLELENEVKQQPAPLPPSSLLNSAVSSSSNKSGQRQVYEAMSALALCHNVTPIVNDDGKTHYEASSPDEIAMVKFSEKCGVKLAHRTTEKITLRFFEHYRRRGSVDSEDGFIEIKSDDHEVDRHFVDSQFKILNIFPFTSESKRMGIIVQSELNGAITFYAKGADVVMKNMVESNEWMEEEVENLSREGLRTLVFAQKRLSLEQYNEFTTKHDAASISMSHSRAAQMMSVRQSLLEQDMELLAVTGVEDKLQDAVQSTIEMLRNAHIKIWMLTGDKVETAKVVARSSRLIAFGEEISDLMIKNRRHGYRKLDQLFGRKLHHKSSQNIIIDGASLEIFMNGHDDNLRSQFLDYVIETDVVIACRCSPTQKAEMVSAVQQRTAGQAVCCAVGDGGNDVSMILAANVGVGLLGKEGQQAALSSDFSIDKFEYLGILLLWHGRLAYKNTALMAQFVIHRGLIIAFITVFFSVIFYFAAIPLFTGVLMVGYTCVYTSLPVFSLVLDRDVSFTNSLFYPELYHPLQDGQSLNGSTFLLWIMRSFFQGSVIMLFTLILFETELHHIVSIVFTALILTELFNVYLEIHRIHWMMVLSELFSIVLYLSSVLLLSATYFDAAFVFSSSFWIKSFVIAMVADIPVAIMKWLHKFCHPSMQHKLKDEHQ